MHTRLVPVGNSKGLRLPKAILQATGIEDSVTLRVVEGSLVIRPARLQRKPREGWAEAIAAEVKRAGSMEDVDPAWEGLANDWDAAGWR